MKKSCWKRIKSGNPYITHAYQNNKIKERVEIHYDIGFGKQRNATVYDLKKHGYTGFKNKKTHYGENEKDALKFAKSYMERHDKC